MNSLNSVGLSTAIAAVPILRNTPSAPSATGDSPFLSLLRQGSSEPSSESDAPAEATASQPGIKKDSDPLKTALLNLHMQTAAPAENTPLPVKLSLNLFGPKSEAPKSEDAKSEGEEKDSLPLQPGARPIIPAAWSTPVPAPLSLPVLPKAPPAAKRDLPIDSNSRAGAEQNPAPAPLTLAVPVPIPAPLPSLPEAPASAPKRDLAAESARTFANGVNPRVNAEETQASAPRAPQLAFALRLTPTAEHSSNTPAVAPASAAASDAPPAAEAKLSAKAPESPGPAVAGPEASQSRRPAGDADASADDRHPANRQSDPGTAEAPITPLPAAVGGVSSQAAHFAIPQDAPAPAAPVPTEPPAVPQVAPHAATAMNSDPPAKTGTANELSFSVSASDQQKVEVRVMDRAGEVRVSVRTPNEELASTLRGDLGSLTGKLNQSGYTTEAFAPASHTGDFSRDQHNTPGNQQQGGGQDRGANRQGQPQDSRQDGRAKRPAWLDELENSMAKAPAEKDAR